MNRHDDPRAYRYIVDHLRPGAVITRRVLISNMSPARHRIAVSAGGAVIRGDQFLFADDPAATDLPGWVSFDHPTLDLTAWARRAVRVTVRVPADATAGERYGVVWAAVSSRPGTSGVTQVNRVGVRLYLDIGPGGESPTDFTIDALSPARGPDGRPILTAAVHNTGRRAVDLTGSLALTDGPGGSQAGPFAIAGGTTLPPGDAGTVRVDLPADVPDGAWTATLTLSSGTVRRTATARVTFPGVAWAAGGAGSPLGRAVRTGLVVVVVAGLLGLGLVVARRRGRRPG
jgi:hypothetical protein